MKQLDKNINRYAVFDQDLSSCLRRPMRIFTKDERSRITYFYLNSDIDLFQIRNTGFKVKKLSRLDELSGYNLIFFGYRFPELFFLQSGVLSGNTFYLQAGVNPKFIQRNLRTLYRKYTRFFSYLRLLVLNFKYIKTSFFKIFINVWLTGKETFKLTDVVSPSYACLFDNASKDFYQKTLCWDSVFLPYPWHEPKRLCNDLRKLPTTKTFNQYVCQSLVEDSRVTKRALHECLSKIIESMDPSSNLLMLLHPRSDLSIYKSHKYSRRFLYTNKDYFFDVPTHGHYSNLFIFIKYSGVKIKVWNIENHTIPSEFIDILINDNLSRLNYTEESIEENFFNFFKKNNL